MAVLPGALTCRDRGSWDASFRFRGLLGHLSLAGDFFSVEFVYSRVPFLFGLASRLCASSPRMHLDVFQVAVRESPVNVPNGFLFEVFDVDHVVNAECCQKIMLRIQLSLVLKFYA